MKPLLLLFDLDGTIINSPKKMRQRFEIAIEKIHGKRPTYEWEHLEGMIDHGILLHGLEQVAIPKHKHLSSLPALHEAAFEYFASIVTEDYKESLIPGVVEFLDKVKKTYYLGVFTGNYEKTAWKKLEMIGLRDYFDFGLFGHEAETRNHLAQKVQAKAKDHFRIDFQPQQIVFIGDTPRDIECAREIQAHILSVTTGKYSLDQLQNHDPEKIVANLSDPSILTYLATLARTNERRTHESSQS